MHCYKRVRVCVRAHAHKYTDVIATPVVCLKRSFTIRMPARKLSHIPPNGGLTSPRYIAQHCYKCPGDGLALVYKHILGKGHVRHCPEKIHAHRCITSNQNIALHLLKNIRSILLEKTRVLFPPVQHPANAAAHQVLPGNQTSRCRYSF